MIVMTKQGLAVRHSTHEIDRETNIPAIRGKLCKTQSLDNMVKALGQAQELLVKRMQELEKSKKLPKAKLKQEGKDAVNPDEAQVTHRLELFEAGGPKDENFGRMVIELFVNFVTI